MFITLAAVLPSMDLVGQCVSFFPLFIHQIFFDLIQIFLAHIADLAGRFVRSSRHEELPVIEDSRFFQRIAEYHDTNLTVSGHKGVGPIGIFLRVGFGDSKGCPEIRTQGRRIGGRSLLLIAGIVVVIYGLYPEMIALAGAQSGHFCAGLVRFQGFHQFSIPVEQILRHTAVILRRCPAQCHAGLTDIGCAQALVVEYRRLCVRVQLVIYRD